MSAHYSGTATSVDNLLDAIRTALLADSWTVNLWASDSSTYHSWTGINGAGMRLHVQKTAADGTVMYFNLRSTTRGIPFEYHQSTSSYTITYEGTPYYYSEMTGIAVNGSTGFNGGLAWDYQTGAPTVSSQSTGAAIADLLNASIPYWITINDDTVMVTVEYETDKYHHLAFGCLEKAQDSGWTGGQFYATEHSGYSPSYDAYLYGTNIYHNGAFGDNYYLNSKFMCFGKNYTAGVYADVDSDARWRIAYDDIILPCHSPSWKGLYNLDAYSYPNSWCSIFLEYAPNTFNSLAPLSPLYMMIKRSNGRYSHVGYPSGIRFANILQHDAEDEISYGTDVWKLFPADKKDATYDPYYYAGFAHLIAATSPSASPSSTPSSSPSPSSTPSGSPSATPSASPSSTPSASPSSSPSA